MTPFEQGYNAALQKLALSGSAVGALKTPALPGMKAPQMPGVPKAPSLTPIKPPKAFDPGKDIGGKMRDNAQAGVSTDLALNSSRAAAKFDGNKDMGSGRASTTLPTGSAR